MGPLFILTGVIFNQTVGPGQVTLFERAIAFVTVTVELQLCGNVDLKLPVNLKLNG